jgi:predicted porin
LVLSIYQGETMKKQIIPAVLAAAFAMPLAAQQVSVYGIIDQAYRSTNPDQSSSTRGLVSGSFATSRVGIRGTEELGGGLRASFTLEGRLDASTGATGAGTNFFSRESSVTLSGGFGAVTVGRTDTSASEGIDTLAGAGHFGNFSFVSDVEYAGDRESTVRYSTPVIGGVQAQIGRSMASTQGAETDSVSLTYTGKAFAVGAGHDRAGSNNYTAVGGRYDFGFASAGVMAGQRKAAGIETDVLAVTARVPLPANLAAHGAYRTTEVSNVKTTVVTAGISKALSKRTTLLAVYQDTDRGASAGSLAQVGVVHSF